MAVSSFRKTFINGIAFAVPLGIILYVFLRLVQVIEKIITPLAKRAGIDTILGEITLTVITIIVILIIVFICGILMQLAVISKFRLFIEGWILRLVPSLNYLKVISDEKIDAQHASAHWKPVFVWRIGEEEYTPGYLIEESDEWVAFVYTKFPSSEPGEPLITKKSMVRYKEITMKELRQYNRQFGKGYLSLVDKTI